MAVRHFQLTLAAAAQRVSEVYGAGTTPGGPLDIPYRQVLLQAAGAAAFLGDDAATTSTDYGTRIDSTDLQPVTLGPFSQGPLKLSDLYAAGAGATLHVFGIPY